MAMMDNKARSIVTGVGGFIGSHLAEHLLELGHEVIGIDCFTNYYDVRLKHSNLATLLGMPGFTLVEDDLTTMDVSPYLRGCDFVFHQAGQAGVRASWGESFIQYTNHNILATQRLLEALKGQPIKKLVFASSSSVYGNARLPMLETALPQPVSPYGVTKLAAEHLCYLYHANYGVPYVALRYFTVYGPRQRPDMAINKFIRAIATGNPITVYGDGTQSRDFTYVEDIVRANALAATAPISDGVVNICGGSRITVAELLRTMRDTIGREPRLEYIADQRGDVGHTGADSSRARRLLGFVPRTRLEDGLRAQIAWQLESLPIESVA